MSPCKSWSGSTALRQVLAVRHQLTPDSLDPAEGLLPVGLVEGDEGGGEAKAREYLHLYIETSQTKHVVMKSGGGVFVFIIL